MKTDSKRKCKFENNANLCLTADDSTLAWLSEVFHCDGPQAAAILYDVTKTRKGGNEFAESK